MRITRVTFLFGCLVAVGLGLSPAVPAWKTFKSTKYRYTVRYPASWYLFTTTLTPQLDSLDILNFPPDQRLKGVILKDSGARIMVGPAPSETQTMDQRIKEDTKFHTQISQRELNDFAKSRSGCIKLVEVTSLSEVGPEAYFAETSYYCSTRHRLYGVSLLNWKRDPKQNQLRAVALKVALSLRSW